MLTGKWDMKQKNFEMPPVITYHIWYTTISCMKVKVYFIVIILKGYEYMDSFGRLCEH